MHQLTDTVNITLIWTDARPGAVSGTETDIMTKKLHGTDRSGKDFGLLVGSISLMVVLASVLILFGTAGTSDGTIEDGFISGGFEYQMTGNSEVALTNHVDEPTGVLTIPENVVYEGISYTVISIGDRAFFDCSGISTIILHEHITSIGYAAFAGCTGTTAITFQSETEPSVDSGSFATNNVMQVTTTGWNPHIILDEEALMYTGSDGFYYGTAIWANPPEQSIYTYFPYDGLEYTFVTPTTVGVCNVVEEPYDHLVIPGSVYYEDGEYAVVSIMSNAFEGNEVITEVTIPNTVQVIEECAFADCSNLEYVLIPGSVKEIGTGAFNGCESLTAVSLNSGIEVIGTQAFRSSGISFIRIPETVEQIGLGAFEYCHSLTSVDFMSTSPPTIGQNAFSTETTLQVKTPGWDPVIALSEYIGDNTTVVWANPLLDFLSDPLDGTITYIGRGIPLAGKM